MRDHVPDGKVVSRQLQADRRGAADGNEDRVEAFQELRRRVCRRWERQVQLGALREKMSIGFINMHTIRADLVACDSAGILDAEGDSHNFLVKTATVLSELGNPAMSGRTAHLGSSDVPKPLGGLEGPLVTEPLIFKPEYSKVVYDRPNPNSNLGSISAYDKLAAIAI